jgi:hypothetical protein
MNPAFLRNIIIKIIVRNASDGSSVRCSMQVTAGNSVQQMMKVMKANDAADRAKVCIVRLR